MREAAESGMVVAEVIEPLLNMTATVLANATVHHRLDAPMEIEEVQRILEALYEDYLKAYNAEETVQ